MCRGNQPAFSINLAAPESTVGGKSVLPADSRSQCAWELLPRAPLWGSPKASVLSPHVAGRSRGVEDDEADCPASSNDNKLALSVRRKRPQRVFAPVIENETDRLPEALQALLTCTSLSICSRNFCTIGDVPCVIAFHDGGELVPHEPSLARQHLSRGVLHGRPRKTALPESCRSIRSTGTVSENQTDRAELRILEPRQ